MISESQNRPDRRAAPENARPREHRLTTCCREHPAAAATAFAVAFEAVTLAARFGFGLESTRDTASTVGALTFGVRLHHGYPGLILATLARLRPLRRDPRGPLLFTLGAGLAASDLFHHFVVLALVTGSPQFDLFYPSPGGKAG